MKEKRSEIIDKIPEIISIILILLCLFLLGFISFLLKIDVNKFITINTAILSLLLLTYLVVLIRIFISRKDICPAFGRKINCKESIERLNKMLSVIQPVRIYNTHQEIDEAGRNLCESVIGNMFWFNPPLTRLITQHFYEVWLQPAIMNNNCKKIIFILDNKVEIRERWDIVSGFINRDTALTNEMRRKVMHKFFDLSSYNETYKIAEISHVSKKEYIVQYFGRGSYWMTEYQIDERTTVKVPIKLIEYDQITGFGEMIMNEIIHHFLSAFDLKKQKD